METNADNAEWSVSDGSGRYVTREEADKQYVTRADANRMVSNAIEYLKFTIENGERTSEIEMWELWYRRMVVTSIVLGCIAGAVFVTEMFVLAGGGGNAWKALVIPAVVLAWVFFIALGSCMYSRWKARRLSEDLVDWRSAYPRVW